MDSSTSSTAVTVRVPRDLMRRIKALRGEIGARAMFALKSQLSRSDIIRYLLLKGVETLEREVAEERKLLPEGDPSAA